MCFQFIKATLVHSTLKLLCCETNQFLMGRKKGLGQICMEVLLIQKSHFCQLRGKSTSNQTETKHKSKLTLTRISEKFAQIASISIKWIWRRILGDICQVLRPKCSYITAWASPKCPAADSQGRQQWLWPDLHHVSGDLYIKFVFGRIREDLSHFSWVQPRHSALLLTSQMHVANKCGTI